MVSGVVVCTQYEAVLRNFGRTEIAVSLAVSAFENFCYFIYACFCIPFENCEVEPFILLVEDGFESCAHGPRNENGFACSIFEVNGRIDNDRSGSFISYPVIVACRSVYGYIGVGKSAGSAKHCGIVAV